MSPEAKIKATQIVKQKAAEYGFMDCGIAEATYLESEAPRLESWLKNGFQGKMDYMNNYFDLRLDVRKLVPGAKSVIVLLFNYYPSDPIATEDNFKIARYAYGRDYHLVLKDKLNRLLNDLRTEFGEINGRCFVDSGPVLERVWAQRSGLGWIGKNTLLLSKSRGSYFFISELIVDLELEYDNPVTDHCGSCTACIDECPTDALTPYQLDSNKCISYLTIELRDEIEKQFEGKMNDWIFGCDICQEVCPWNRFSIPHSEPRFEPSPDLRNMNKDQWREITEDVFRSLFPKSAVKRTKFRGLQRNIEMASRVP